MSLQIVVLPEAEEDARAAARWYEDRRGGLGLEFLGAFQDATDRAAGQPDAHPSWAEDPRYRWTRLQRFPYLLFYEIRGGILEVEAVVHERRKPGFWLGRSSNG